ncbi:MAG: citramalate synthase [Opitutales bacterium]|nr:citramalate synthase [Opitutales bacterium]
MTDGQQIFIYDTTLRDGTQGEGVSFTVNSKIRIARMLDQFGIDYIEGGWPGSNPRDMSFFEEAQSLDLKYAKVAAFGSTRRANLKVEDDAQIKLLLDAKTPVVTIFGKTWLLHVKDILRTTPDENLAMIQDSVAYLLKNDREVIYDAEHFFDGYLADADYAMQTLHAAAKGGAKTLVLCDTNGGQLVESLKSITSEVVAEFPELKIGVHCHNDSGVGVAVSLAGVEAGAVHIQGTFNGFGERNGNANLATIIPNLGLKMGGKMSCSKNMSKLRDISLFVDEMANLRSDTRAPYVGASSFAHKGGVHANAVEKVRSSYEHIDPSLVGNRTRVLVSDMSGRSSIMMKAREMGLDLDEKSPELKTFLQELKELEYRGYEFEAADASFKLLIDRFLEGRQPLFELIDYRVIVEHRGSNEALLSEATVKINVNGNIRHTVAEAHGPVGALDIALRRALQEDYPAIKDLQLVDYKVRILEGADGAQSKIRVQVESTDGKETWGTVGASDNIIEASWAALQDSVEYKIYHLEG